MRSRRGSFLVATKGLDGDSCLRFSVSPRDRQELEPDLQAKAPAAQPLPNRGGRVDCQDDQAVAVVHGFGMPLPAKIVEHGEPVSRAQEFSRLQATAGLKGETDLQLVWGWRLAGHHAHQVMHEMVQSTARNIGRNLFDEGPRREQ